MTVWAKRAVADEDADGRPVASSRQRARPFYGWILLGVFWLILVANLSFPTYGGAVLNTIMARELGFSRQMLGLPYSVFLGVIGLASPLVAAVIERIGVRWTLTLGNAAVALGALAMAAWVHDGLGAILAFGVMTGFGVAAGGNLTTQCAIPRWFVRRRALAFALVLSATALGGAVAAPTMSRVVEAFGGDWRAGWWIMAAMAAAAAALAAVFVREQPGDVGQSPDGAPGPVAVPAAAPPPRSGLDLGLAWRNGLFWVVALSSAAATGTFGIVLAHGVSNARDAGYSAGHAAEALGLISLAALGGKLVVGALGDRSNPAVVWAALMGCMGAGAAVAGFGLAHGGLYMFAILFGVGLGGFVVSQPTTVAAIFGARDFPRIAGAVFFVQALGGIALPWLAGWMFDTFGSYQASFALTALACLASLVALLLAAGSVSRSAP